MRSYGPSRPMLQYRREWNGLVIISVGAFAVAVGAVLIIAAAVML